MGNFEIKRLVNGQGRVAGLEIGGMLVLDNSKQIKDELVACSEILSGKIKIELRNVLDLDIAFIQLLLGFIKFMNEHHISYAFEWKLSAEHHTLLENVGFGNELFLN